MRNVSCLGFQAVGMAAGIKKNRAKDLGLIYSETPAAVAGVFTRNAVQAAPVTISRERVASGMCQAVIVNSGNANCCTGERGLSDAREMARIVAESLKIHEAGVCVSSTGVIGEPLPMDVVRCAVPRAVAGLRPDGIMDFAEAIMTTDRTPKVVEARGLASGKAFHIVGVAKGAGMIRPDMATMLCFVLTDAAVAADLLQEILREVNEETFNCITIDGDTSTNDTVLVLASGRGGAIVHAPEDRPAFRQALLDVMGRLSRMVVTDGEGVTKTVDIHVRGARTRAEARTVADTIGHSCLVKTALFGEDANWGRIIAAAGRSGVPIDPGTIQIDFDDVRMVQNGVGCGKAVEAEATRVLKTPAFTITVDLGMGSADARIVTSDLSLDYVRINADYRS